MATNKAYNVDLNVKVGGDTVSNINELLEKLITLKNEANNLSDSEIALNVVVRNQGFDAAMKTIATQLKAANTDAKKVGEGLNESMGKAVDDLQKNINRINASVESIGTKIEQTFKGIEKSITTHVKGGISAGFKEGMKGWRESVTSKVTGIKQTLASATSTTQKITDDTEAMTKNIETAARSMKLAAQEIRDSYASVVRDTATVSAHDQWSENHISIRDQRAADAEDRRVERQHEQEMARIKAENRRAEKNDAKEQARLDKKNEQEIRALKAQTNKIQKAAKREEAQAANLAINTEKTAFELAQKKEAVIMTEQRMRKQLREIADAEANAQARGNRELTEMEKKADSLAQAEKRVADQVDSTNRKRVVSSQAILKAAEDRRKKEYELRKEIAKQLSGYDKIRDNTKKTVDNLNKMSNVLQKVSSMVGSINSMFSTMRSWANSLGNMVMKAGQTGLRYATQAARTMASTASEQYQKLEVARIGFENFFGKEGSDSLIPRIQQEAINAPGLNSGDLADYVRQLAPVSNSNADLALNAALGMLKTIQYGGAEGSEEMEYVIKNVRDVISKGQATAIDLRQFNRAMPILEDVLGKIGKSDFIKDGKLNITKENAKDIMQAFADINTDPSSPVADIYDKMGKTLQGLTEAIKEQFTTGLNNTLVDLGFYDKVKELLQMVKDNGILDEFFSWIGNTANKILDTLKGLDWKNIKQGTIDGFSRIWEGIKKAAKSIMTSLGSMNIGDLIRKVSDMIANFIEGFGTGVSKILDVINWAEKNLGSDILNKAANFLGMLASPLGNLLQSAGKLAQDVLYFFSRGTSILGQGINWGRGKKLSALDEMINSPTSAALNSDYITATLAQMKSGAIPLGLPGTEIIGGSLTKRNAILRNKANDTISYWNAATNQWNTAGGVSNMKWTDRMALMGNGSTIKGAARSAMSGIKNVASKAMKGLAIYSVGEAITDVGSEFLGQISGSSSLKQTAKDLGDVASAAIAAGSQFGPVGAALAGFASALIKTKEAANDLKEAQQAYAKSALEASISLQANRYLDTMVDNLRKMGIYEEYEDKSEDAYEEVLKQANSIARNEKDPEAAIRKMMQVYTERYYRDVAGEKFIDYGTNFTNDQTGGTSIGDKNTAETKAMLKSIYDNLVKTGLIEGNGEGWADNATGSEIWNYLSKNGVTINTREFLTGLSDQLNGVANEFNAGVEKTKNTDIALTLWGGEESYDTVAEYMQAAGFVLDGDTWKTKALIEAEIEATKTPAQKIHEDSVSKQKSGDGWGAFWGYAGEALYRMVGGGNPLLPWSDTGWFNFSEGFKSNGGRIIKPIYRADGGDSGRGVDTVPAMLQPGEFVVRKTAASKIGSGILNALNYGDLSRAASMLNGKVSNSWNNSRSFHTQNFNGNKTINNFVQVVNRHRSGSISTYYGLANRLAAGV